MNGVTAEVAVEISVLFQDDNRHACPREQIASHHSRRSATDDHTASL
jgi:hypothetical protein